MKQNKIIFLICVLAFILLIAGASALYSRLSQEVTPTAPTAEDTQTTTQTEQTQPANRIKAPDFTVYDADGNAVHLSDFIGKPVVLNFWASWCGPCQSEMPGFDAVCKKLGDEVHFVMVNMTDGYQETMASASNFLLRNGYTFPVYYDTQSEAAMTYGIYSVPITFFIDAEGYAVYYYPGAIPEEILESIIEELLQG